MRGGEAVRGRTRQQRRGGSASAPHTSKLSPFTVRVYLLIACIAACSRLAYANPTLAAAHVRRHKDTRKLKKLRKMNLPSAVEQLNARNDPSSDFTRSKLRLPAPQVPLDPLVRAAARPPPPFVCVCVLLLPMSLST